jgi:uncharacterized membrane protein YdcZ (DUF606 family)
MITLQKQKSDRAAEGQGVVHALQVAMNSRLTSHMGTPMFARLPCWRMGQNRLLTLAGELKNCLPGNMGS